MLSKTRGVITQLKTIWLHPFKHWRLKRILKQQYKNIESYHLSKQFREKLDKDNPDYIYGELDIADFIYLLALVIKPHMTLIDLGCGDGKLCHAAALRFKHISIQGIEKVPELVKAAQSIQAKLKSRIDKQDNQLVFSQDDICEADLTPCDLIYMNLSAFSESTWQRMEQKLVELPQACTIISVERKLTGAYKLIYQGRHHASWGPALVYIYTKTQDNQ